MARESLRSFEKVIAEWLETVPADEAATLAQRPSSTIVPAPAADTGGQRALAVLARLASGESALTPVQTLGQGGMGVVRLAEQVALGRMVAVKTLRADRAGAALDLLREAWVTGSLEHPNVVPVYDISLDQDGSPQIVLKRIDGHAWSELIDDAEQVREVFGAEDLLAWNLDILGQVLNAVRFAHSRGIIHRDLKPDNVMIGDFGEVYLLDWGIALSLRDDGSGRLPLASAARDMAGTPVYMAPEMLGGQTGVPLSERTDIYLCGSMLYEVLTGKAPHDGTTALAVVSSVVKSCPDLPDDAPPELVRICRRAMDPDPDGRFENAEQLRLALRGYLQHRGSERLAAHAEQRVRELEAAAAAPDAATPVRRQELYKLFGAARFGFHEAIAGWRSNQAARAGLRRAGQIMVGYELDHGDPGAAAALLAEVDDPPAELSARVTAAVRAADQRRSELESLAQDHDARIGTRTRTFLSGMLGIMFTVFPLLAAGTGGTLSLRTPGQIALWSAGFLVVLAGFAIWARESMTRTVFNRRLMASIMFLFVAQIVLATGAELIGIDPLTINLLMLFLWFAMAGMAVIAIEWRLAPTAVGYLLAFLAAARWPDHRHYLMSASNFLLTVNAVWIWRPRPFFRAGYRSAQQRKPVE